MISHHHRAIFVHIQKCAGQRVETVFLNDLALPRETRAPFQLRLRRPALRSAQERSQVEPA